MKLADQGAAEWLFDYTVSAAKFKCPAGRIARVVALYPQGRERYGEVWTEILRVGLATLQDEPATLQDEAAILQDEAATLQDEAAILQDEAAILQDEAAILQDETAILQVETAILQDETAILQVGPPILRVGMRFPPVEMTILSLGMAIGEVATAFLTAVPVSGERPQAMQGRAEVRPRRTVPAYLAPAGGLGHRERPWLHCEPLACWENAVARWSAVRSLAPLF